MIGKTFDNGVFSARPPNSVVVDEAFAGGGAPGISSARRRHFLNQPEMDAPCEGARDRAASCRTRPPGRKGPPPYIAKTSRHHNPGRDSRAHRSTWAVSARLFPLFNREKLVPGSSRSYVVKDWREGVRSGAFRFFGTAAWANTICRFTRKARTSILQFGLKKPAFSHLVVKHADYTTESDWLDGPVSDPGHDAGVAGGLGRQHHVRQHFTPGTS